MDLENAIKISDDAERAAAVEKTVRNMTQAQLEEAGEDILKNEEVMRYISSSQMEGIMKSNEFNDAEKADFAAKRATAIEGVLQKMAKANQTLVDVIGKASVAQLEALGVDKLKSNAVGLSTSQMDDLKKSKSLLESEFQAIAEARNAGLIRLFDDEGERDKLFRDRKDKDRAKLPKEILLRDEAVPYLTSETLKKILDNDELTADERTKMRENIAKNATGDHKEKLDNYFKTPHGSNF